MSDGSVPAVDLASAVVGVVISVASLGFFIVQGIEASQAQQRSEEEAALWRAIQDSDSRNFSAALAARKQLALDSQSAYSLLFSSIENKRLNMAVGLVKAGMPLLEGGDAHPELIGEYVRRQQLHDPQQLAATLLEVASMAGEKEIETLSAALKRAREDDVAQRLAERRDAALKESLTNEILNDPKFGFAASMSPDALRAAKEGQFPSREVRNTKGETVLFFALRDEQQCAQAPQLIQAGVDVHQVNHLKVTPLMLAAGNCNNETVRLLLERRVDIQARSFDGSTALMYASVAGQHDNVKLLLTAGAHLNARTDKGETALSLARQQGFDQIVKMLEQARR